MKQGETITISGEFSGIANLNGYTVLAMVYCQNAINGYKKILFTSDGESEHQLNTTEVYNNDIGINGLSYSFVIPSNLTAKMQGECQVEIALQDSNNIAISENYATFAIQNSVLGQTIAANGN